MNADARKNEFGIGLFLANTFISFQRLHLLAFCFGTYYRGSRRPLYRLSRQSLPFAPENGLVSPPLFLPLFFFGAHVTPSLFPSFSPHFPFRLYCCFSPFTSCFFFCQSRFSRLHPSFWICLEWHGQVWYNTLSGEMSERLKEHDWKSCERAKTRSEGSNPSLSAR